jgi:hypothetical protein
MGTRHGESDRLTDGATVRSVFHRDGMTRPHGGHCDCNSGWESGRNDLWRPRRIRFSPPKNRAVARFPPRACRYYFFR